MILPLRICCSQIVETLNVTTASSSGHRYVCWRRNAVCVTTTSRTCDACSSSHSRLFAFGQLDYRLHARNVYGLCEVVSIHMTGLTCEACCIALSFPNSAIATLSAISSHSIRHEAPSNQRSSPRFHQDFNDQVSFGRCLTLVRSSGGLQSPGIHHETTSGSVRPGTERTSCLDRSGSLQAFSQVYKVMTPSQSLSYLLYHSPGSNFPPESEQDLRAFSFMGYLPSNLPTCNCC